MSDIELLNELSTKTNESREKLDIIYNELLLPIMKKAASERKEKRIQITDNCYRCDYQSRLKELFGEKYWSLQNLISTEMKPYLIEKGFTVIIPSPSYYVAISWEHTK